MLSTTLDKLTERLERATILDKPSDALAALLGKVMPGGRVGDVASGTPIGHPLHPVLVTVPIGSWVAASYLDLTGGNGKAAKRLVGLGNLAALPAVFTGANDWLTTSAAERRVGLAHAILNDTAFALYVASWLARRRGRRFKGAALALAGAGIVGTAGWLGGHLSYALGVGVDTTAFQHFPGEWTDVCAESDVRTDVPTGVEAAGVPVLLIREQGVVLALSDRCTHRGAPLHEGEVSDGCVTCPWHGSRFALVDGSVKAGPATRPQPVAEVRVLKGRVQVRRNDEPRELRTNPAGH
ncbi:MAG: Rieske 2Fe-2S domain-containing protein [Jatrophihabitantaceae bacterium]